MDVELRQRNAAGARRRRDNRLAVVALVGAMVLGASALTAVMPAERAGAASQVRVLSGGGFLSVISADGCSLKPARLSTAPPKARRDYKCTKKSTAPSTATTGTIKMVNGGVVSIVASGCALKVKRLTTIPTRYRRDVQCVGKSGSPSPPSGQPPAAVTGGATWRGIWSDDFSGTSVDTTKWNVQNNSNFGSGNNEDECYRSANVTESGGTLRIAGRRQSVTGCGTNPNGGSTYYFTSGMVTTKAQGGPLRMKFRQGYLEAQMRVPRGNIYWPAFWLTSAGDGSSPGWPDYGEVDITEIYGSHPDISESNFWRAGGSIGARNTNVNKPPSSATGINVNPPNPLVAGGTNNWHRYGIKWSASRLDWFVDGVLVGSYNASSNADLAALGYQKSIILNLAMGGDGPRSSDHGYTGGEAGGTYNNGNLAADLPGVMEINYVRLWQP